MSNLEAPTDSWCFTTEGSFYNKATHFPPRKAAPRPPEVNHGRLINSGAHTNLHLAPVDYLILALYFAFVLGIGWVVKRQVKTSEDFLTSGHSIATWITSLAFLAANLGAQEVIGMCASGAKYGILTAHV